jgi:hypothetical protein
VEKDEDRADQPDQGVAGGEDLTVSARRRLLAHNRAISAWYPRAAGTSRATRTRRSRSHARSEISSRSVTCARPRRCASIRRYLRGRISAAPPPAASADLVDLHLDTCAHA